MRTRGVNTRSVTTSELGSKELLDVATHPGAGLATIIDEASSTITYIGKAQMGSAAASPVWQIFMIETSGTLTTISWADGNDRFDNVWNDRASLTYS